ncbi:DUF4041 domain-containing protein [uncultured Eubacterium sp.]|uniref:DUF4041 domain-containing protein n=1 Tax=uncultured Eubacterium sp. TaxID=165185 RepID=UPI0025D55310|nr:DUF4041 domain-containing protein [uncultured Eubacterium sp.]
MISKNNRKWYLQTWFIAIMFFPTIIAFALPPFFIFPIIGIICTILQSKANKQLLTLYGEADQASANIQNLNIEYQNKCSALEKQYADKETACRNDFENQKNDYQEKSLNEKQKLSALRTEVASLKSEIKSLEGDMLVKHYNFSNYDGLTSEECKNKLSIQKTEEQDFIKSGDAFIVTSDGSKKEVNDNKKQLLRCFNAECDNLLLGLTYKNVDSVRNKVSRSFESLNKIFSVDGIALNNKMLEMKLEELNLVYTFELKKEQEREQQKAIKEQMLEEEKVRREIERQKAKLEKDQTQCNNEVKKLLAYMQKSSSDVEKQLYVDKIRELEAKLKQLEEEKNTVLEREANARAGYVYVISNIGSFGEDIYKIGMTRRLEPMDRIKELSSASVPFSFDVHAMIFSDNAPELENTLHKHFEKNSVNRVNLKKEFFHVSLDEIEKVVKENFNNTVTFTRVPVAEEYRQTLNILHSENK